ncbi:hypothetical protein PV325_004519 [Microctonus aethiopoides]|nr:hypothetical protein PV325_004519 [Microctonus aethiopoides]KAK0096011.1 hypothetical protein PV326_006764 [Microctonus aethiopoides]
MSQDFENLASAPISTGYFTFKSEKNWSQIDSLKYNDFFTLDVKKLSTIYNCIPFNHYVEVDDNYFTKDQLTFMNSTAEQAKKEYESELEEKNSVSLKNIEKSTCEDTIEEDLDFLLSLKEPIKKNVSGSIATNTSAKLKTNESKIKSHSDKSKPIDLEKWLDSVLDD